MKTYICVYLGAALVAIVGTPIVTRFAKAWGLVDAPGVRKVHKSPIPRVGGIALVAAMLALVIPVLLLDNTIGQAFRGVHGQIITLLASAVFVFFVGLVDDIHGCPGKVKLACLVVAATAICASGSRIDSISALPLFELHLGWLSWPVTILWIVGVTVALNLIDGLDGLAAGVSAIVCVVIAIMAFRAEQLVMGVLMLAMLGSLTGFLFYNFNPAKIFMGDCGSMFLGFMVGAGSVVCATKKSALLGIAVPALALAVPIVDTGLAIARRAILERRSIFAGDRRHLHHRLLDRGLKHRNAVLLIYAFTALGAGLGMCLLLCRSITLLLVFFGALAFVVLVFHFVGAVRLGEMIDAIRRNRSMSRQVREEKSYFEKAQLCLREAGSFKRWWAAITCLAGELEFDRLAFTYKDDLVAGHATIWRRSEEQLPPDEVVNVVIPCSQDMKGSMSRLEVGVLRNGSLETVGRRLMLLGRLLDESAILAGAEVGEARAFMPVDVHRPGPRKVASANLAAIPSGNRASLLEGK